MLAYAANRPAVVDRRPHPNTLLFIIGGHVALLAAVMSAKMDLPRRIFDPPPKVFWVPQPKDPAPVHQTHTVRTSQQTTRDTVDHPRQHVQTEQGSHELDTAGEDIGIKPRPGDFRPIQN